MAAALRAARRLLGEGDTPVEVMPRTGPGKGCPEANPETQATIETCGYIYCRPGGTGAGSLLLVGMMGVETLRFTLEKLG